MQTEFLQIKMTSKGTFTLPAKIRKQLGLNKIGDKLLLEYHPKSHEIIIKKPADLRALQAENAAFIKAKGIKPLTTSEIKKLREERHAEKYQRNLN